MRGLIALMLLIISITGCRSDDQETKKISDINFYIKTDASIDSVLFANFTQDREYQFMSYSDTLNISLKDSINDYYFIKLFTKKGAFMYPLWLDGKNLVIKGKMTDKLKIDTVIGSNLYYKSIEFRKKYKELLEKESNNDSISNFLFNALKQNIVNPFSIEIANNFYFRNMSNKNELRRIYDILAHQEDAIKNHLNSPYKAIKKILTEDKIDLSRFQFYNTEKKLISLQPSKGKKYLIDFWFMDCAPCIKDHKLMTKKLDLLKSSNIELVGISIDDDHGEWKEFLKEKNYRWLNLREVDMPEKKLRTSLLISIFPTYLLIDSEGNILYRTNSFTDIEKHLI
jgi:peroxiredoxin